MTSTLPRVQAGSFLTLHYRLAGPAGDIINTFSGKPATLSLAPNKHLKLHLKSGRKLYRGVQMLRFLLYMFLV